MSSRFKSEIVHKNNNEELNKFFSQKDNSSGNIQIRLDYRPDIWPAIKVHGTENDIIIVHDTERDQIAGTIICSHKKCYFHGELHDTVYISGLKVGNEYKRSFASGYLLKTFKSYCLGNEVKTCFFSAQANNKSALQFFAKSNDLMPICTQMGVITTYVFKKRFFIDSSLSGYKVRFANQADVTDIIRFIKSEAKSRANLPNYTSEELSKGSGRLKGFKINELVVAKDKDEVVGILGIWDQTKYRRWLVHNYSLPVRILKPFINILAKLMRYPTLSPINHRFSFKILSLMIYKNNTPGLFEQMFNYIMNQETEKGANYSITLHSASPLNSLFKKKSVSFSHLLYKGAYSDQLPYLNNLNLSNFYIEQGSL
jgi:hypothetical protein